MMLEAMKAWLQTYPAWEGTLLFDYADAVPGSIGLYPRGLRELTRREDVQGNVTVRYCCDFFLRRAACPGEENARWLLAFQNWVIQQAFLGLTPKFGDLPETERMQAFAGKLDSHKQAGSALYTVQISAEFTKIYEVK